jgi:hypothetical protein
MKRAALVLALVTGGCNVYGPGLLVSAEGGVDAGPEACAATCAGKCTDLQTDENNCGACGHGCELGCVGGLCTPTVLKSGLGAPHGIVVTSDSVYFANRGSITVEVMSKIDGTGEKFFATSQLFPERLASDATNLYWTNDANVSTVPGGSVEFGSFAQTQCAAGYTVCYLASNLPSPYGIAVHGANLFVTTLDATNNGPTGCAGMWTSSVLSCPVSTGCAAPNCATSGGPGVIASGQTKLAGIAADATNVYWADFGAHEVRFCPQPSCPGGPKTFAQIAGSPFDVVSYGSRVYFTDRTGGNLYACPTTGCGGSPTVLASGLDDPLLVAVDQTSVYVTLYASGAAGKGSIVSCDLPSCANGPVTVAANLKGPYGVALDSTYVYWTEEGTAGVASTDGSVSKLRRP